MKSKILVVCMMLIGVLLFSSCMSSAIMINVEVSCDEFEIKSPNLENEFEIVKGDKIKAKLCANPSTGFSWELVTDDESVMKLESHEYLEPEGDLVGASGTDVWIFRSVKAGAADIKLEYSQPWEGGTKTERSYTMDILVAEK
jgi:inhibitor of cysteine peptidase